MSTAVATSAQLPHFINGQWVESTASEWLDVPNPATGEVLARVPLAGAEEVNKAVEAAAAAFPAWRRTPPEDRIQPLFKLKHLLEEEIDEMSRTITRKTARPSPRPRPRCGERLKTSRSPAVFR